MIKTWITTYINLCYREISKKEKVLPNKHYEDYLTPKTISRIIVNLIYNLISYVECYKLLSIKIQLWKKKFSRQNFSG